MYIVTDYDDYGNEIEVDISDKIDVLTIQNGQWVPIS